MHPSLRRLVPRPGPLLVAVALLLLLVAPSSAQDSSTFGETIEVNIANVEVVVVDADGQPVRGLTSADFTLEEDGKVMPIRNFYEVRGGERTDSTATAIPSASTDTPTESDAEASLGLDSRSYVLYFDNQTLEKKNRKRVVESLREQLGSSFGADDFASVAALTIDGNLQVLQTFSSDWEEIDSALDAVLDMDAGGAVRDSTFAQMVRDIQMAQVGSLNDVATESLLRGRVTAYARQTEAQVERSLATANFLLRPLAGLPGQKAVIYMGEGLTQRPAASILEAFDRKFGSDTESGVPAAVGALDYDLVEEFEAVAQRAQESGVRFYTIDAGGKRRNLRGSAGYGVPDIRSQDRSYATEIWSTTLDRQYERDLREGLETIAAETGAAMFVDSRDYGTFLRRIDSDLSNFYSLGFQPDRDRDGEFHQLEITTNNPQHRVFYRQRYQNKTSEQLLVDLAVAQLQVPRGWNGLEMNLRAGEVEMHDGRKLLPLEIRLPVDADLIAANGGKSRLTAVVVSQDEEGRMSPTREVPLDLEIDTTDLDPDKVPIAVAPLALEVRDGRQMLAIALRDQVTGVTSAASFLVDI